MAHWDHQLLRGSVSADLPRIADAVRDRLRRHQDKREPLRRVRQALWRRDDLQRRRLRVPLGQEGLRQRHLRRVLRRRRLRQRRQVLHQYVQEVVLTPLASRWREPSNSRFNASSLGPVR